MQLRVCFQLWKKGKYPIVNSTFVENRPKLEDITSSNIHENTINEIETKEKQKDNKLLNEIEDLKSENNCVDIDKDELDGDSSYLIDSLESFSPISVSKYPKNENIQTVKGEAFNLGKEKNSKDDNCERFIDAEEGVKSSELVGHYSIANNNELPSILPSNLSFKIMRNDSEIMSKEIFEEREMHNKMLLEYEQRLQQIEECMSLQTSFMGDAIASTQIANHLHAFLKAEEEKNIPEVTVNTEDVTVNCIQIEQEKKIKRSKNVRRRSRINRAINCQNSFATNKIV